MESRTDRANRYRKEASKYAELAGSDPLDMMGDVHRRLGWRRLRFYHPKSVAGMFGWLKSKDHKNAESVLALLAKAIKEVHPNRYIDPSERGIVKKRKLSQLNLLLGKDDSERFTAIAFDDLVAMTLDYERRGYAKELGTVIAHDAVLIALVAAAMHERHGRAMRDEVRERAGQLLRYINPPSSAT